MNVKEIGIRTLIFCLKPLGPYNLFCYMIKGEKCNYLIDTGCGENDALEIKQYLKANNINKPIIIINTHYHWDHIWGNRYFDAIDIISSKICLDNIKKYWNEMMTSNLIYSRGKIEMYLPTITFNSELEFMLDNLKLFVNPGHTTGGICIYDSIDKTLYVGDNIGDNDIEIIPELEETKEIYLNSLYQMKEYDFNYLLSGHNVIKDINFINDIINKVIKEI